jgi:hypothetical protein
MASTSFATGPTYKFQRTAFSIRRTRRSFLRRRFMTRAQPLRLMMGRVSATYFFTGRASFRSALITSLRFGTGIFKPLGVFCVVGSEAGCSFPLIRAEVSGQGGPLRKRLAQMGLGNSQL